LSVVLSDERAAYSRPAESNIIQCDRPVKSQVWVVSVAWYGHWFVDNQSAP